MLLGVVVYDVGVVWWEFIIVLLGVDGGWCGESGEKRDGSGVKVKLFYCLDFYGWWLVLLFYYLWMLNCWFVWW